MKLKDTYLCAALDCQEITEQSAYCPSCCCTQMVSLASILNREAPALEAVLRAHSPAAREHMGTARMLARLKLSEMRDKAGMVR